MSSRGESRLRWAIAVALLVFAGGMHVQLFRIQASIDFYQFWGIAKARKLSREPLGSPYGEHAGRYAALLNQSADRSTDLRFKRTNSLRRTIDPSATPLLYLAFAPMPRDYSSADLVYRIVQLLALLAAVTWAAHLLGSDLPTALTLAASIAILYQPVQAETAVGNVNSLQLLACVALLAWTRQGALAASGAWFAGAVATLFLFKPNLALVCLALGGWLAAKVGRRRWWVAPIAAGLAAVLLVAASSAWLGTLRAWPEWIAFLRGVGDSKLADYPASKGNYALVGLLRGRWPSSWSLLLSLEIALLMGASWLVAIWMARRSRGLAGEFRARREDPWLLVSSAILVGLAASPLVWFHYALLALVPCLWLGMTESGSRVVPLLGFCSLLAYSLCYSPFLVALGLPAIDPVTSSKVVSVAWLPAWIALLWRLARAPVENAEAGGCESGPAVNDTPVDAPESGSSS